MANINLYQNDQGEKLNKPKMIDTGLMVGIAIFVLILAGYGGLEFYLRSLDKKIEASKAEEISGKSLLVDKEVDAAASFQQRMEILELEKASFSQKDPNAVFVEVQKTMIEGVVANGIGFRDKVLHVSFVANDFETLAKQILSFKQNKFFQNVEVKSSTRDEEGKVTSELNMGISL